MFKRSVNFAIILLLCCAVRAQDSFLSHKRVLFLGNSITYDGRFIEDIEAYLKLKYPKTKIEIINTGLPSETVSGLSEPGHADNRFPRPDLHDRLRRVLLTCHPDLVIASYGINDGIYMPFDEERFSKYRNGLQWLHAQIIRSGAKVIHVTAPYYDEARAGNKGYERTMDRYAEWLVGMKDSAKWNVINVYDPMKQYLTAHRELDKKFHLDGFEVASDGVHPNDNAHWLMARTILLAMGEKGVDTIASIRSYAQEFSNGLKVVEKIREKQRIMKDAWLTASGHARPEMKAGMKLADALTLQNLFNKEIDSLLLK